MPDFVDRIIIVNDRSVDRTEEVVLNYINEDKKPTIRISNILDNIKPNRFNRAEIALQEMQKNEMEHYVPS